VDVGAGPRLNYWVALKGGLLQYSGTARPTVMKLAIESADKIGMMTSAQRG
jgi:hypothetical protein